MQIKFKSLFNEETTITVDTEGKSEGINISISNTKPKPKPAINYFNGTYIHSHDKEEKCSLCLYYVLESTDSPCCECAHIKRKMEELNIGKKTTPKGTELT